MSRRINFSIAFATLVAMSIVGAQGASGLGVFGAKQNDTGAFVSVSQNAKVVVWETLATNLSTDHADTLWDLNARDTDTGVTQLVSRATGAGPKGNGNSRYPTVSADGRFVAFTSESTNLGPDDTTTRGDTYVRDLQTGTTILADRATGVAGVKGNGDGFDGMSLSADGRYVAWTTYSNNLDPADTDGSVTDVYVRDLQTKHHHAGRPRDRRRGREGQHGLTQSRGLGRRPLRRVRLESHNLSPDDTDTAQDIYVRDLQANTTTLVSQSPACRRERQRGVEESFDLRRRPLRLLQLAGDEPPPRRYRHDHGRVRPGPPENTTTLASRASGISGVKGNAGSFYDLDHNLSADGRYVSNISNATNLDPADTESFPDMYVRDLQTTTTILASRANGPSGAQANFAAQAPSLSADGRYAAFMSGSTNLSPDDTDTKGDLYVRDTQANLIYPESRGVPGYARPKGASPLRASLVPAYKQCSTPNRTTALRSHTRPATRRARPRRLTPRRHADHGMPQPGRLGHAHRDPGRRLHDPRRGGSADRDLPHGRTQEVRSLRLWGRGPDRAEPPPDEPRLERRRASDRSGLPVQGHGPLRSHRRPGDRLDLHAQHDRRHHHAWS